MQTRYEAALPVSSHFPLTVPSRAFHEIKHFQWPFMILFFILAGASLDVGALRNVGLLGLGYVVLRIISRIIGGWIGAFIGGAPPEYRPWFGIALLPQAGVALGMALIAAEEFPAYAQAILTVTIGTTVVFQLLGPSGLSSPFERHQLQSSYLL